MTRWHFWGEKEFSDVYENIYIRSLVEDWFGIVSQMAGQINSHPANSKRLLDIGCGEGHTTKQILDRIDGPYTCDLLEPDENALASAEAFLLPENNIGEMFPRSISTLKTNKKYDIVFTSHTNYYWGVNEKDYRVQLDKYMDLVDSGGRGIILTLPKNSGHYKIMLRQIYPEFNYAEYISDYYKNSGFKVDSKELQMRIYVGDMLTTKSTFNLNIFYQFIHNTDSYPNESETNEFLEKIKNEEENGYIDFKDHLIVISK